MERRPIEQRRASAKRLFSVALGIYGVLCFAGVVFVWREFGTALSVGLALMLCLPFLVSLRMLGRRQPPRPSEFFLLAALLVVDLGGAGYVLWYNYDRGMDQSHVTELKAHDFIRVMKRDPAFRRIEAEFGRKDTLFIEGSVDSSMDLDRLEALRKESGVPAFIRVRVADQ